MNAFGSSFYLILHEAVTLELLAAMWIIDGVTKEFRNNNKS